MRVNQQSVSMPFAAGYALNLAWIFGMFIQSPLQLDLDAPGVFGSFYLASIVFHMATLCVLAGLCTRERVCVHLQSAPVLIATGCILLAGTAAATFGEGSSRNVVLFGIGAALTGIGSASLLVLWGRRLSRIAHLAAPTLCLSYVLASVLYFALAQLPTPALSLALDALPVASLLVFAFAGESPEGGAARPTRHLFESRKVPSEERGMESERVAKPAGATTDPSPLAPSSEFVTRTFLAAALFGLVIGLIHGMSLPFSARPAPLRHTDAFLVVSLVTLVPMFVYLSIKGDTPASEERFATSYRIAVLLVVAGLLVALVDTEPQFIAYIISVFGYICFKIVLWTLFAHIRRAESDDPALMFALGEAFLAVGLLVGNAAMRTFGAMAPDPDFAVFGVRVAIAVSVMILLIAHLFVLSERRLLAIVMTRKQTQANSEPTFQSRIDALASEKKLSPRETEVLGMFARGRSSTRIADDLYISKGTVTTHLRNIYRKCDVHSRQELLDLIEEGGF